MDHPRPLVKFTIYGEPASKANSRMIVRFGNRPASIKSPKARAFATTVRMQCPKLAKPLAGDLRIDITMYYASRRPDLDESALLDAMQTLVYTNDRQIKEKHVYWGLDRTNPRCDVALYEIG